jgi:hypothetical protein
MDTGAYETDTNELASSDRLLARPPAAQVWARYVKLTTAARATVRASMELTGETHAEMQNLCKLGDKLAEGGCYS